MPLEYSMGSLKLHRQRKEPPIVFIEDPYLFVSCFYDLPIRHAALIMGISVNSLLKINRTVVADPHAKWPCQDIYEGRNELYTKSDVAATRRGEIYKLRARLEEFPESSNLKALIEMYEEIDKGVHNYSVIKGYQAPVQPVLEEPEPLPNKRPREDTPPPAPSFDLLQNERDELGLGPIPARVLWDTFY